ncbi:MAG: 50S ribosomal protein L25, partial [Rhodospirillales bacterium]
MAQTTVLAAEVRDTSGKGAARETRRAGRVLGVIYGNKEDQVMITIDPLDLQKQLRGPGFFSRVFEI